MLMSRKEWLIILLAGKGEYYTVVNMQMFPSEMVTTGTKVVRSQNYECHLNYFKLTSSQND